MPVRSGTPSRASRRSVDPRDVAAPAAAPAEPRTGRAAESPAPPEPAVDGAREARRGIVATLARGFDLVARWWEARATQRRIASGLVVVFVLGLVTIEAAHRDLLPAAFAARVPRSPFGAVGLAFGLLLVFEVAGLVLALAKSVADSLGKQFELLALILMREAFVAFTEHSDPLDWTRISAVVPDVLAEMAGALVVFALLVPYYRVQRHRAITADRRERDSFVAAKKVVALALLVAFVVLALESLRDISSGGVRTFFSRVYTVLVLSDVMIVLLSLRYTSRFPIVFRNAGFAAATAMARLALSAPPYTNALLATVAMVFALALSLAYNAWAVAESPAGTAGS